MKKINDILTILAFLGVMIGGCGVMNEAGELQPVCIIIALAGALILLIEASIRELER